MKKLMILSVFIMALENPVMAMEKEPSINAVATKTSEELPEDVSCYWTVWKNQGD